MQRFRVLTVEPVQRFQDGVPARTPPASAPRQSRISPDESLGSDTLEPGTPLTKRNPYEVADLCQGRTYYSVINRPLYNLLRNIYNFQKYIYPSSLFFGRGLQPGLGIGFFTGIDRANRALWIAAALFQVSDRHYGIMQASKESHRIS